MLYAFFERRISIAVPSVPPGAINVTMVTTQSAYINWLPISEENSNGAILGYKIILTSGHNNTMDFDIATEASDNEFSYQLNMLAPNTTYRFYVYGYNINGDGPESELSYFTTKGKRPQIWSIMFRSSGNRGTHFAAGTNVHLGHRIEKQGGLYFSLGWKQKYNRKYNSFSKT
jgi:hypothetical protein